MVEHVLATIRQRRLLMELARNDFRARYTGSLLGVTWAFVQPVLTILLYLFIYKVGFRSGSPEKVPFVLWLIVGITPWFFFTDALVMTTQSLLEYSFLVKKVLFEVSIVPTIKLVSSAFIHLVVWGIVLAILLITGHPPTLGWLQAPYYFFALFALLAGIGWFTSSITPFFRDMTQVVGVVLQFAFWVTPVLWSVSVVPAKLRILLELNPLYYVIEGLRGALLLNEPFWAHPRLTLYFWSFVLISNVVGYALFRRVRPHLPDVL